MCILGFIAKLFGTLFRKRVYIYTSKHYCVTLLMYNMLYFVGQSKLIIVVSFVMRKKSDANPFNAFLPYVFSVYMYIHIYLYVHMRRTRWHLTQNLPEYKFYSVSLCIQLSNPYV